MVEIRQLRPADVAKAMQLPKQAGWNQVPADWQRLLALSPAGCFAGWIGDNLVATSSIIGYGSGNTSIGWIGMVLVDEAYRREGYGTAIFEHALETGHEWGLTEIGLDATEAGRPIYLRNDFVDITAVERWNGSLRPRDTNVPEYSLIVDPPLSRILTLDRAACGINREALITHLYRDPTTTTIAVMAPETDACHGYAIVRPGRKHDQIGPLIAPDEPTTLQLLTAISERVNPESVIVDLLDIEKRTTLKAAGLQKSRELSRMTNRDPASGLIGTSVVGAVGLELG